MNSSDATVSAAVEDIWRVGLLEALARPPCATPDERVMSSSSATMPVPGWLIQRLPWPLPGGSEGSGVHGHYRNIAADRILAARRPEEIVAALFLGGCRAAADRIEDLHEMTRDGFPDEPPIVLPSLRELALFLLSQRQLVDPQIGLGPNGLLLAEWASADRGVLAMKFLPDGIIQFAGVSPVGSAAPRLRVHGELPKAPALDAVRAFLPSVDGPDTHRVVA